MPRDGESLATVSAQVLRRELALFAAGAGYAQPGSIPAEMTFMEWCEDLARKGLKVDGRPWSLDNRPALRPIYEAIPSTLEQAHRGVLVIMKGAQLGLTVWEMLADLYLAIRFEPAVLGLFLPSQDLASDKSERRFMRLVRTVPGVYQKLTTRIEAGRLVRMGEGNILTRTLGESSLLFLWTTGRVSTESRPMDILSYDEVQEMTLEQIDKTDERMSASQVRFKMMLSTANWPELDIHYWFNLGTQEWFYTECPSCLKSFELTDHFPACIQYNTGQVRGVVCDDGTTKEPPTNEYVYVCPSCAGWLADTQRGAYVARNPGARVRSFQINQIQSPTITARDMMEGWNRAITGDQRKTFFNRKLGKPYIDQDQLPVTMAHCEAAAQEGMRLGLQWERKAATGGYVMGIDQMGGFNAVLVKRRLPDGRQALVHAEAVFEADPFARCDQLMRDFAIECCVVEQLPNVNDARRFANRWPRRVFLAGYASSPNSDMISWGDEITRSDRKTSEEDRSRFSVTLQQYKAMQMALFRIRSLQCLFPDPAGLEQDVIERGERKRILLLREWVWHHFTKTALVVEEDEDTRKPKPVVRKVGLDPHFAFANMLCDVAWSRLHGTTMMILNDQPGRPTQEGDLARVVEKQMPGLPAHVLGMLDQPKPGTCGACEAYREGGACSARGLVVGQDDPACVMFVAKS